MADVIVKKTEKLSGQVCAPPSKSYTQRMVIAAALSNGTSKVSNPLLSEDTEATLRAVTALGAKVDGCGRLLGQSKAPRHLKAQTSQLTAVNRELRCVS